MFRLIRTLSLLICVFALLLLGTTPMLAASFKSEWKKALSTTTSSNGILGAWEGTWKSKAHGVSGPLRCIIKDLGNGKYQAHFHAQFHWFRFSYVAQLASQNTSEGLKLSGSADLGWMGGLYKYIGQASPQKYISTYHSKVEHGVLELSRPVDKKG